jgi:hypothetical protein
MGYFFKFVWLSQNIWTLREEDYVSSRISAGGLEIRNNNADTIKTYYVSVYYYVWTGKMSGSEVFKKSQEYLPCLPNTKVIHPKLYKKDAYTLAYTIWINVIKSRIFSKIAEFSILPQKGPICPETKDYSFHLSLIALGIYV